MSYLPLYIPFSCVPCNAWVPVTCLTMSLMRPLRTGELYENIKHCPTRLRGCNSNSFLGMPLIISDLAHWEGYIKASNVLYIIITLYRGLDFNDGTEPFHRRTNGGQPSNGALKKKYYHLMVGKKLPLLKSTAEIQMYKCTFFGQYETCSLHCTMG